MRPIQIGRRGAQQIQERAVDRDDLLVWTIYDHPADFPGYFVARPHSSKEAKPLTVVLTSDNLEHLRALLPVGLTRMDRSPGDEPQIMESWI